MSTIVDRRNNSRGKSINNRKKFLKRVEGQIKKALPDIMSKENITDSKDGGSVKVPIRGLSEPNFQHDHKTGNKDMVRPGNDKFSDGDTIDKPKGGQGGPGKGKGSNAPGTTEDSFHVILSRDEFLHYFFDDLELPNLVKKFMESTENFKNKRAGYIKYGVPSRLNIKTSYQQSLARQISIRGAINSSLKNLEEQLRNAESKAETEPLFEEIERKRRQLKTIPFFEDVDLRYNHFERIPEPITSAVMFCIMDVSASMGYHEKDISKRFFTLLYLFLSKQYKHVELVFIRHHTEAKEVDEEEFFNSRESGGTVVAPSLKLMKSIIRDRFPTDQWNIYCCQASDGDVWSAVDADDCQKFVKNELLPVVQYMAYIEINQHAESSQLWTAYKQVANDEQFSIRCLYDANQIWPVFKALFKKREKLLQEA